MINFKFLENNKEKLRLQYLTAKPFPHLVLKDICDKEKLIKAYESIPVLDNKSRDYMFAKNKFEKSNYGEISPLLKELQEDLSSKKMNEFLSYITVRNIFVDPKNHGGGLHQGRKSSFLDMHLDYNYHPINNNWWREVNLLLYMNKDWKQEYGGHLELKDLRTGEEKSCDVDFNTLIIQQCHDYTLHGYKPTKFPEGNFRTSIATYAFSNHIQQIYDQRTTDWFPDKEGDSIIKKWLGRNFTKLVSVKSKVFGSGTAKNQ
ncbi:2OG-Fe(II) oxygenase [uncultured Polaribacter sp.]|uniref:2OG-Fe(II) oxygenase n=1 Tax=uncultured Polaribacter sp. TaxID=174711 RepID=UPI00261ECFBD|nr:2OG-Fe(II) oxygenase [uncultured Polaribacter sp.]